MLCTRLIALAIVTTLAVPVEAMASTPQFQDVMKGFGQQAAAVSPDAVKPKVSRPRSIRYKPRQKPVREAAPKAVKTAARKKPAKPSPPEPAYTPSGRVGVLDLAEFGGFNLPDEIVEAMPRFIVSGVIAAQARAYLVQTATVGGTMMTYGRRIVTKRLKDDGLTGKALAAALVQATRKGEVARAGVEFSIAMLHDVFAIRLARAVRQGRAEGITNLGAYSAYRGPDLGVGGMRDKAASIHASGGATDVHGIDSKAKAAKWKRIANENGLYVPYASWVERNHTQLMPIFTTHQLPPLRRIIVEAARSRETTVDRVALWKASGVKLDAIEPVAVVQLAMHTPRSRRHYPVSAARAHHRRHHYQHHHRVRYAARAA